MTVTSGSGTFAFRLLQELHPGVNVERAELNLNAYADDYYSADVVLAARAITTYCASFKPASKLINAWMAGVPALLGPEPAFEELRKSDLDFIVVRSADDAVRELRRLQENPDLYHAMVENGLHRSKHYSEDVILDAWIQILNGPIASFARNWYRRPRVYRKLKIGVNRVEEKFCARLHELRRRHGESVIP